MIQICLKYARFTSQMHPFYVFNTPCNVFLSYRLRSKILLKHTRFALQILLNTPILSCKYAKNSQIHQFYIFNTPHNVFLSRRYGCYRMCVNKTSFQMKVFLFHNTSYW